MSRRSDWLLPGLAIVLAGGFASAPAWHGGWLWDDDVYITANPALRTLAGLRQIWFAPPGVNYFPIAATVQWGQWQLWGNNPLGYHLTNSALHVLGACLLWRLLAQIGVARGWVGGLLFAVHPVGVESVAWVSELKNVLSLPPLLLALSAYVDFDSRPGADRGRRRFFLLSLGWFLVAMLAKSTVVMFPAMILLYGVWRHHRLRRADLAACLPFFLVSLGLGLVTLAFEGHRALGVDPLPAGHFLARLAIAGVAAAFYLGKCFFPAGLLAIYPRWQVDPPVLVQWLPWLVLISLCIWLWPKRGAGARAGWFGLAWFFGNLIPVLGFVPMSYQNISWTADHFAYLSLAGGCGLAAAALAWPDSRLPRYAVWTGVTALVAALAISSHRRSGIFRSEEALWRATLRGNPAAWLAENDLGNALAAQDRLDEAMGHYRRALGLRPAYPDAEYDLGLALTRAGHLEESVEHYQAALRLRPGYAEARNNLGSVLCSLGRLPEAQAQLEQALRLKPEDADIRNNYGRLLSAQGRLVEAMVQYEYALRLRPGDPIVRHNLAATQNALQRRQ